MFKGKYERSYKSLSIKYATLILEFKHFRDKYNSKDANFCDYAIKIITKSITELGVEKVLSDKLYKENNDKTIYRTNLFLLGIKVKEFSNVLNEHKDLIDERLYLVAKDYIDYIIYKIEKVVLTKHERKAEIF